MYLHGLPLCNNAFTYINFVLSWLLYVTNFVCYIGETCTDCLEQHISPDGSDICVGDTFSITFTTSQPQPITLFVDGRLCHSGGGGNNLVTCREQGGDVFQTSFSYNVTAMNTGVVTFRAHTIYYGAEWYSTSKVMTIRECDSPEGEFSNYRLENVTFLWL